MIKCIIAKAFESTIVFTGRDGVLGRLEPLRFGISGLLPSSFLVLVLALVFALLFGVCVQSFAGSVDPCDCPRLECSSCENQTGLTFYSEKCGNNRVRSRDEVVN